VSEAAWTVGEVASFAGVTVRALHHYDAIGLLSPSGRSDAGYRRYRRADLERLQRVLVYRELELPLARIAELLDEDADPLPQLRAQRDLLVDRRDHLDRVIATLERTMEARRMGIELTPDEMLEVFGDHDPAAYADEVEDRWGDTEAYRESRRRTSSYRKEDWEHIKAESEQLNAELVATFEAGVASDSDQAMDLAERARAQIDRWFYPLPHAGHVQLARMYLSDPRFTATYEEMAEGLASYWHDAIVANARRHGVDVELG
jgi:MerR family transcriptional regulator, thiopeptide resistance regulator